MRGEDDKDVVMKVRTVMQGWYWKIIPVVVSIVGMYLSPFKVYGEIIYAPPGVYQVTFPRLESDTYRVKAKCNAPTLSLP